MFEKGNMGQKISAGDNCILVQAGRDINFIVKKCPPNIRLVKMSVEEVSDGGKIGQKITVVLKNNGDITAVLMRGILKKNGKETIKNCNHMYSQFSLIESDWTYDININDENPEFSGRHAIAPNEIVSFDVMIGRDQGGYEITVYRCYLVLEFDEGESLETGVFFLRISGPTVIAGSYTHKGPTQEQWGRCWADNIRRCDTLGYDIRSIIHSDSVHIVESAAPGLMGKKSD